MTEPRLPRRPRWLFRGVVALVLGLVLSLVLLMALAGAAPSWYTPPPDTPESRALGESVERRVLSTLSDAHPFGAEWTLVLTADEAGAWINHRLPMWLANQRVDPGWDASNSRAMVSITPDAVAIGFRLSLKGVVGWTRVPLPIDLSQRPAPMPSFGLGRLTLPIAAARLASPGVGQLVEWADHFGHHARSTLTLDDGRRVILTRIKAEPGSLTLTFRTEGKVPRSRAG